MNIFTRQPKVTDKDRVKLQEMGLLNGWNMLVKSLKQNDPNEDDLKKAVLIELESEAPRKQILEKLVVQIQKKQRQLIFRAIRKAKPNVRV